MKRIYNIARRVFVAIILAIISLYLLLYIAFSIPLIQEKAKNIAETELSKLVGSEIKVGRLYFQPFNLVMLSDIVIKDKDNVEAVKVDKLGGGINIWRLLAYQRLEFTFAELIGLDANIYQKQEGDPLNVQFIIDAFASKDPNKPKTKFDLTIHSVVLRKCDLKFDKMWQPHKEEDNEFDANHIELKNLRADISLPRIANDDFEIYLKRLSFEEVSGFTLKSLKGRFHITNRFISVSNLNILLPNSEIIPNDIRLEIDGLNNIADALIDENVQFSIPNSKLTLSDLRAFVPAFSSFNEALYLLLSVEGNRNDIDINEFKIKSENDNLLFDVRGSLRGLDSIPTARIDFPLIDFTANSTVINSVVRNLQIAGNVKEIISRCGNVSMNAAMSGSLQDVKFDGTINSSVGPIKIDLEYIDEKYQKRIKGVADIDNFMLGTLLNNTQFGNLSVNADIDLLLQGKDMSGAIKMAFPTFYFNNYDYKNISIDVVKHKGEIEGLILVDDDNLDVEVAGMVDISKENRGVNLTIDFSDIDLYALNLLEKYENYKLSGNIIADFKGDNLDNFTGSIAVNDVNFSDLNNGIRLNCFELNTDSENISINSDILDFELNGVYEFRRLPQTIQNILSSALPSIIEKVEVNHNDLLNKQESEAIERLNIFDFNLVVKKDNRLTEFFNLPIRLVDDIVVTGHFDESEGNAELVLSIPRIQQGKKNIIHDSYLGVELDSKRDIFDLNMTSRLPGKNGDIFISLDGTIANSIIDTNISWAFDRQKLYKGDISLSADLQKDTLNNTIGLDLNINKSSFFVNDTIWNVEPSQISYRNKRVDVNNINVWRTNQHVKINGSASSNPVDTITLDLENVNLDYIFKTLKINHVTFGGTATGKFYATNLFSKNPIAFTPELKVKSFTYNNAPLGNATIKSKWINSEQKVEILADIRDGVDAYAKLNGGIWVTRDSMSMDFETKKVNIKFLQPFMSAFSTDVEGRASGKVLLYGTFKDVNLKGDVFADTIRMRIDYINSYFAGSDSVHFKPNLITIKNFKLYDKYGNTAMLNGELTHDYLREASFKFKITDVNNLLCYDTNSQHNPIWYGTIFGTGLCEIIGKPGEVKVIVDMTTGPKSEFTFVLNDKVTVSDYEFLTFTDSRKKETIESGMDNNLSELVPPSLFILDLKVSVKNDALMTLVMDPVGGDRIKAYGEGGIQVGYNSSTEEMTMRGAYNIERGSYNFTLQDIIIKNFKIRNGSSVKFAGDPLGAELDIDALYRVNTNLSDLDKSFSTDKDLNRTNVPVDAVLMVDGKMQSPEISFDIELPTLTQDVVRKVKSIISTDDMMNRQIIYLLALNRFYTPEYMGSVSNNNELASVASSTISSQLSNILGELSSNLSFSPYFRTDKGDFSDVEVDLALSSTLLNNRLLLNGNFGYRDKSTSTTTFIGDFDIEYLLNRQGTLRLKAYNHFNDQNYYLKSALTTQGVGIILKHDFDRIFDFLNKNKPVQNTENTDSISKPDTIIIKP